jgi:LysM repeat protein
MKRRLSCAAWLFPLLCIGTVHAESMDCRVIIGKISSCNPYTHRLLRIKEEADDYLSQKYLMIDRTPPSPQKKHLKIIPVSEMVKRYIPVEGVARFQGKGDRSYFKSLKQEPKRPVSETKPEAESVESNMTTTDMAGKDYHVPPPAKPVTVVPKEESGTYTVQKGDVLSKIALMFGMKVEELMALNNLTQKDSLHIGQILKVPLPKEKIDAIVKGKYAIKQYDSLIGIAKYFGITPKALADANHIKKSADIYPGRVLVLPLPYRLAEEKAKKKRKKAKRTKLIHTYGTRKLRVTATAYTSHGSQTDDTPFLAAWNNRLRPGMKVIAVSRDLLYRYGMKNGTKVKIAGLPGYYRVRDKMNKRYRRRIDIYMGTNKRKALRWGRRSVVIYW